MLVLTRLGVWVKKYPYWNNSEEGQVMHAMMIQQVMGGKEEVQKNNNDIKKELGNNIEIKKALENT